MATAPSANDLTRQQLDELDSLLQRMLNLPLTGTEPPPAPPAPPTGPTWRYDAPAAPPPVPHIALPPEPPRPAPVPPFVAPPRPQPVAEVVVAPPPPRPEPPPAPVPLIPPPEPTTPIIERKPTPPSRPAPQPAPVVAAPPPPADPTPAAVEPPPPPLPVLLWPLAAIEWGFDSTTRLLGPIGWLLRSWFGKNLIGAAGAALLVYTAAHLATEAGLVQLPVPLPWPPR